MWLSWAHPITQNDLSILKSLNPLPRKATHSQVLGTRTGTSLRDIFLSTPTTLLNSNPKSLNQAGRAKTTQVFCFLIEFLLFIILQNWHYKDSHDKRKIFWKNCLLEACSGGTVQLRKEGMSERLLIDGSLDLVRHSGYSGHLLTA